MNSKEMRRTLAKPGYWFWNIAPLGEIPDWRQVVKPDESNLLFGYEPDTFLAKQYKPAA